MECNKNLQDYSKIEVEINFNNCLKYHSGAQTVSLIFYILEIADHMVKKDKWYFYKDRVDSNILNKLIIKFKAYYENIVDKEKYLKVATNCMKKDRKYDEEDLAVVGKPFANVTLTVLELINLYMILEYFAKDHEIFKEDGLIPSCLTSFYFIPYDYYVSLEKIKNRIQNRLGEMIIFKYMH